MSQIVLALLFATAAAACRPEPNESAGDLSRADTNPAHAAMTLVQDSLRLELGFADRVRAGDAIAFTLRVENVSGRVLDLYLRGRESTFDVVVSQPDGGVVWRRLEDAIIPAIVHLRTLGPSEGFQLVSRWDQRSKQGPIAPGEYSVRALLLAEGKQLATTAKTLRVVAR